MSRAAASAARMLRRMVILRSPGVPGLSDQVTPLETFGIVGETTPNHHRVNARIPLAFQTTVNVPLTTLFDPPK